MGHVARERRINCAANIRTTVEVQRRIPERLGSP